MGDLLIVLSVILLSAALLLPSHLSKAGSGAAALVYVDSVQTMRIPLSENGEYALTGAVVAEVSDGALRILDSDCPDQFCVRSGFIRRSGQTLVCLPNRVLVRIVSAGEQEVDAVAN